MQDLSSMLEQLRQQWGLSPTQLLAVMIALGGLIGFLFGLIPYLVGIAKKQKRLGLWGLIGATLAGAFLHSIISLIVVAVFLVLILKTTSAEQVAQSPIEERESSNK